ncbi:MAG TPA: cyclodeaminase/cyclohydrolase family protein [Nocardioidaceae bacterium]|jgi:formiminotetrahydrofolate cyclodeaminase
MAFAAPEEPHSDASSLLQTRLGGFLDQLAAGTPAPAGGAAAAVTVAQAAGLVAKAVRVSGARVSGAEELLKLTEQLRQDAGRLAEDDVRAYRVVVTALRRRRQRGQADGDQPADADQHVQKALRRAAEVPAQIAQTAAEVARCAARLAREGKPSIRGDAVVAVLLADAAARAAVHLVEVNLEGIGGEDDLLRRAAECAEATAAAVVAAGQQRPG